MIFGDEICKETPASYELSKEFICKFIREVSTPGLLFWEHDQMIRARHITRGEK